MTNKVKTIFSTTVLLLFLPGYITLAILLIFSKLPTQSGQWQHIVCSYKPTTNLKEEKFISIPSKDICKSTMIYHNENLVLIQKSYGFFGPSINYNPDKYRNNENQ